MSGEGFPPISAIYYQVDRSRLFETLLYVTGTILMRVLFLACSQTVVLNAQQPRLIDILEEYDGKTFLRLATVMSLWKFVSSVIAF